MTQEAYTIWRPEYDGHAPPNWREGMLWSAYEGRPLYGGIDPSWFVGELYCVEPEALNSPNEDASGDVETCKQDDAMANWNDVSDFNLTSVVRNLRQYPADELAKHGITLAEPKDWATELITDFMQLAGFDYTASRFRAGRIEPEESAAIAFIRERVVLKEAIND